MRFSIFTPSHDTRHLEDAYASLLANSFDDWEWVILLNGAAQPMQNLARDPRVRFFVARDNDSVGSLKNIACTRCRGEYLVELDHDDLLTPNALATLDSEIARTGAEFLYSDFVNFRENHTSEIFASKWGWRTYKVQFRDREYTALSAFPPNAASFQLIHYAPNHVRVWSRKLYHQLGGHDAEYGVCDDHELMIRTYLSGAKIHHIAQCLYFYRLHADGSNTYLQRNKEIQQRTHALADRYVYQLIAENCRREQMPMYDLGGGTNSPTGYTPIDLRYGQDVFDTLATMRDGSVGAFRAQDFLEHIPHCRDSRCEHSPALDRCVVALMNETYRVLADGGWFITRTPSTSGRGAFQDPTHCSFWNPNSFWYYCRREQRQYLRGVTARFQRTRCWEEFPSEWHKMHEIKYVCADLVALKGQRQPGLSEV